MRAPAPRYAANDGVIDAARVALGPWLLDAREHVGEVALVVDRANLVPAMIALRDTKGLEYQQLMEIAGVDYPERDERFEIQIAGKRIYVPVRAEFTVEHEVSPREEEIEFQIKWQRE